MKLNLKKRLTALVLCGCMIAGTLPAVSSPAEASTFPDVHPGDWYYEAVDDVSSRNLMVGDSDGNFAPNRELTRAEFVQILYAKSGKPDPKSTSPYFTDVQPGAWYFNAVQWGKENNVLSGTSDTTFSPDMKVSRAQLVQFLYAYTGKPAVSGTLDFPDVGDVEGWSRDALLWATQNGLVSGTEENGIVYLRPLSVATRAMAAVIIRQYAAKEDELRKGDTPTEPTEPTEPDTPSVDPDDSGDSDIELDLGKDITPNLDFTAEDPVPTFDDLAHEIANLCEQNDGEMPEVYTDDNEIPAYIDGKFSDKTVKSTADAIDALNDIHYMMQLTNAEQEFTEVYTETVDLGEATNFYRLQQVYHNIPVYGYQVIVATDESGAIQSLTGHYYPNINIEISPKLSMQDAKTVVQNSESGAACVSDGLYVYVAEGETDTDADTVALCWKIRTATTSYFISAADGTIVNTETEVKNLSTIGQIGELTFPVEYEDEKYHLADMTRNIMMYDANHQSSFGSIVYNRDNQYWALENGAVTAYTSIIKTYDYYANILGRDGTDGKHKGVQATMNFRKDVNTPFDNAAYIGSDDNYSYIEIGDGDNYVDAWDVLAHEYTHAVTDSVNGLIYSNKSGALNEAYSDIIAELITNGELDTIGEDLDSGVLRSFSNPTRYSQPDNYADLKTGSQDDGYVHTNSGIINHAAYLIDQNWPTDNHTDELATLFYKSMYYLSANSEFVDCRHAVLAAAKSMNMSDAKQTIIEDAFQDVGVNDYHEDDEVSLSTHHITGTVKDSATQQNIVDAQIIVSRTANGVGGGPAYATAYTDETGQFDCKVMRGTYNVAVLADGYMPKQIANVDLSKIGIQTETLDTIYLTPDKNPDETETVFASGIITDGATGAALEGVTVKFRKGTDNKTGSYVQTVDGLDVTLTTDDTGKYYTAALPAGQYTLEAAKDGYETGYLNITSGNTEDCANQDMYMPVSGTCGDNLTWVLDSNGTLTISGTGAMEDYLEMMYHYGRPPWNAYRTSIKMAVIEPGVTSIGENAFSGCTSLTSITIPDSVADIGAEAFIHCSSLTSIKIPNGPTNIEYKTFYGCTSLTDITLPDSVTSIGNWAFWHCTSLTGNALPNSLTSIGNYAFENCTSLTGNALPNGLTSIGNYAFWNCTSLTISTIPDGLTSIDYAFEGCTGLTSITIPDSVTSLTSTFSGCTGLTSITIPSSVTDLTGTFSGCTSLTSITIPNSVTSLFGTFSGCTSLTNITIPKNIVSIEYRTFYKCTGLACITIPDSVTSIGKYAFSGCTSLMRITIPNSVTSFGEDAFSGCTNLTNITLPNSVTSIEKNTFYNCTSLTDITIPDSVTRIDKDVFYGCASLTSITIPDSVAVIEDSAFENCASLTNVTIGNGVTVIEDEVFRGCTGLTSITIPANVGGLNPYAFAGCTALTSVTIPTSVTAIHEGVFSGCSSLNDVYYAGTEEQWNAMLFNGGVWSGTPSTRTIHYNSTGA